MTSPLSGLRMLSALKAEGVHAWEPYADWKTRSRTQHTGLVFGPVVGIVIHHTAGTKSLGLVYKGRSDLPGPLAHAHLGKDGRVAMVSAGRANHAGRFSPNVHRFVTRAESGGWLVRLGKRITGKRHQIPTTHLRTPPRPTGAETVDGNDAYYGVEIENLGDGRDPYPLVQYRAAVLYAAAICRAHGWTAQRVIGHKEGTRRKMDPHGPIGKVDGVQFNMNRFRFDVQTQLNTAGRVATKPPSRAKPKPVAKPKPIPNRSHESGPTVRAQAARALRDWPFIHAVEAKHGLPKGLLLAVGSRETNLRNIVGDGGHGIGVWQRDNRSWRVTRAYLRDVRKQAEDAASLLASNYRSLHNWSHAVSAYNAGAGGVRRALKAGRTADSATTGNNYAADVLGRLAYLNGAVLVSQPKSATKPVTRPKPRPTAKAAPLSRGVQPGRRHPQVKELQRLLIKGGYGPIKGAFTDFYGPQTQAAVARFHDANRAYREAGKKRDVSISPKGWVYLSKKAGLR